MPCFGLLALIGLLQSSPVKELAREVIENERRHLSAIGEYTFEYEQTSQRGNSKPQVETGESYMSQRRNIDIPLTRDGKALKPKSLDKLRRNATFKLLADAKERAAGAPKPDGPAPGVVSNGVRMSAIDILRYCRLSEATTANQMLEVRFDNCLSPWPVEAHFPQIEGTLSIDAKSRVIDSWQAKIKGGPSPGALFFEQRTQVAPGGIRVPALNRMIQSAAPQLFPKNPIDFSYRWKNPKRFVVDLDQTIGIPKP
jgi:hypothetical protein